jgi:hypothetical protein
MKKLIILFFCAGFVSSFGQTSIYHPFPDSNASWNVLYSNYQCQWGDSQEYYSLVLDRDTVIGNHVYHTLRVPYIEFIWAGCPQFKQPGYYGAIRSDHPNRKVYFYPAYGTEEELLYDFTLEVGDTVQGHLESYWDTQDTVISIDSVLVGEEFRKRWFINQWYDIYLIEGVGSTFGLIEPSPGEIIDAPGYALLCFRQDGISQYPDPSMDCDLITSTPEENLPQAEITVFPNPTHGKFQITSTNPPAGGQTNYKLQIQNLELVDLYGKIVTEMICDLEFGACLGFGIWNLEFDITRCPAGIYFLRVSFEDQSIVKKIIKFD